MAGSRPNEAAFNPTDYDYATERNHVGSYQQSAYRTAPPTGPPPAYYRVMNRTYSGSLRPILLLSCFVSLCYLLLLGIQELKMAGETGIAGRYKVFLVVQGILLLAGAGVEIFGLFAAYIQRLHFAKLYSWLSLVAYGAVTASQILGIIVLFTFKGDVLSACSTYYQGNGVSDSGWWWDEDSSNTTMSAQDAMSYCQSLWSRSRTWDIIWLLVTLMLGALFVLFGFAYARQLADPSSVRTRAQRQHTTSQPRPFVGSAWHAGGQQTYDMDGNYAVPHTSYPPIAPQGLYAPPQDAPPEYKRQDSTDKGLLPLNEDAHIVGSNVASSSRPASLHQSRYGEEHRGSGETLRGDEARKSLTGHDEDDAAPRI